MNVMLLAALLLTAGTAPAIHASQAGSGRTWASVFRAPGLLAQSSHASLRKLPLDDVRAHLPLEQALGEFGITPDYLARLTPRAQLTFLSVAMTKATGNVDRRAAEVLKSAESGEARSMLSTLGVYLSPERRAQLESLQARRVKRSMDRTARALGVSADPDAMQDFHADQASMLQGPYGAYLDPERAREINRLIAQSARDAEWAEAAKAAKASPASRKAEKIPAPTPAPTDDPGASDLGRFLAWGLMMVGALATILALSLVNSPFTIPYFGLDTLAGQMKIAVGGAALVIVATLFQSLRR